MTGDHPFAEYLRVVGRGPNLSRDLEEHEAAEMWRARARKKNGGR